MNSKLRRVLFWAVPLAIVALGLAFAFRPTPTDVDLATVERGPLIVTTAEEGETRIKEIFVLSAPVRGRALRIDIDAGDAVVAGKDIVAEIEPIDPDFLDRRSAAEAAADVDRAKANLALAEAELTRREAELAFANSELARVRKLIRSNTVSERALDDALRSHRTGLAETAAAEAAIQARRSELAAAEARLLSPHDETQKKDGCACLEIVAPVSGRILRVLHESAGVVAAGEPLVEIGDRSQLEIVVDFLSSDAVRIEQGQRVIVDQWGGPEPLAGIVERVEPFGFTKVSALGIEEQRVNVIVALSGAPETWARLGHAFQVEAKVVLWEAADILKAPLTALFRDGGDWAVFVAENGRAELRKVRIGQKTDLEVEILDGLSPGETIIRYPNSALEPGGAVRQRSLS